jgi:transcriptional regulator with XRE-family HTH domain
MNNNTLRDERLKRGLSQTKLCMLTGIAQSDLSAIENGRKVPHAGWRLRIARALKIDAEMLFGSDVSTGRRGQSREPGSEDLPTRR